MYYNYYVLLPDTIDAESDIYLTVESFYQWHIPEQCKHNWDAPLIWFKITNARTMEEQDVSYYEFNHEPILITKD